MENKLFNTTRIFFTLAVMVFFLGSCASSEKFMASSVVPAAEGTATVSKDKNENYAIDIKIINLADPQKLDPSRNHYVVWLLTDDNETKNIGQITVSQKTISKKLVASFKSVSPNKPKKIFITSEDDVQVDRPGSPVILSTGNF